MDSSWVPVALVAIIVVGAVGGQLVQMTLKELLPLLRTLAEQKRGVVDKPDAALQERLRAVEDRLEQLESGMKQLGEEKDFMRQLRDG
jgi:hypothetical protein